MTKIQLYRWFFIVVFVDRFRPQRLTMRRGLRSGAGRPRQNGSNLRRDRKSCRYVGCCYDLRDLDLAVAGGLVSLTR